MLIEYAQAYASGRGDFVTTDFHDITGRPPRSFAAFARDHAHAFTPRSEPNVAAAAAYGQFAGDPAPDSHRAPSIPAPNLNSRPETQLCAMAMPQPISRPPTTWATGRNARPVFRSAPSGVM